MAANQLEESYPVTPTDPQWEQQMADDLVAQAPEGTTEMTVTRIIRQSEGRPRILATIHLELLPGDTA